MALKCTLIDDAISEQLVESRRAKLPTFKKIFDRSALKITIISMKIIETVTQTAGP